MRTFHTTLMSSLRVHQLNFEISFLFFQNSNKNLFDQLSTRFDLILEQGVPKVWRHFVIIVVFMITVPAPPAAHGAQLTSLHWMIGSHSDAAVGSNEHKLINCL